MAQYSLEDILGGGQPVDRTSYQQSVSDAKRRKEAMIAAALQARQQQQQQPELLSEAYNSVKMPQVSQQQQQLMIEQLLGQRRNPFGQSR